MVPSHFWIIRIYGIPLGVKFTRLRKDNKLWKQWKEYRLTHKHWSYAMTAKSGCVVFDFER